MDRRILEDLRAQVLALLEAAPRRTAQLIALLPRERPGHVRSAVIDLRRDGLICSKGRNSGAVWCCGKEMQASARPPTELEVMAGIPGVFPVARGRVHWLDQRRGIKR